MLPVKTSVSWRTGAEYTHFNNAIRQYEIDLNPLLAKKSLVLSKYGFRLIILRSNLNHFKTLT